MAESESNIDHINTLDKFSKQLHMYTSDQLRNALKISIGMAKGALRSGPQHEALLTKLEEDACMMVFSEDSGFRAQPGDEVQIEVAHGEDGLHVYRAIVDGVVNQGGNEVCCLKDFTLHQRERRGAPRFPVHVKAEFSDPRRGDTRQTHHEGVVLNISSTGLCLAADNPMTVGSGIVFTAGMGLESMEVPPGTPGTITRVKKEEGYSGYLYSYGVKFHLPLRAA